MDVMTACVMQDAMSELVGLFGKVPGSTSSASGCNKARDLAVVGIFTPAMSASPSDAFVVSFEAVHASLDRPWPQGEAHLACPSSLLRP